MFPIKSLITGVNALQATKLWQNIGNVQCAFFTKTLHEAAGLPPKPKKPLSPYFRFLAEVRPKVTAENPNKKMTDIVRIIADSWKTVDAAKKSTLEKTFLKEKEMYAQKIEQYNKSLTPEMLECLQNERERRTERRTRLTIKKRNKDLDKPKRPTSAFVLFVQAEEKKNPGNFKRRMDIIKNAAEKWKTLSEAQKEPYVRQVKQLQEKYQVEIKKWEARMIKEGNLDLVRSSALEKPPTKPSKGGK